MNAIFTAAKTLTFKSSESSASAKVFRLIRIFDAIGNRWDGLKGEKLRFDASLWYHLLKGKDFDYLTCLEKTVTITVRGLPRCSCH